MRIWLVTLAGFGWMCVDGQIQRVCPTGVDAFHSQLDSEHYSKIFAQTDGDFKKAGSQEEFEKLVSAVYQKLEKAVTILCQYSTGFGVNLL